jgi:hypothetical protein
LKTTNSNKISESQLLKLKERYDKAFIKYWTAGNNPPKFNPISMEEFKKRLDNPEFFEKYGRLE